MDYQLFTLKIITSVHLTKKNAAKHKAHGTVSEAHTNYNITTKRLQITVASNVYNSITLGKGLKTVFQGVAHQTLSPEFLLKMYPRPTESRLGKMNSRISIF